MKHQPATLKWLCLVSASLIKTTHIYNHLFDVGTYPISIHSSYLFRWRTHTNTPFKKMINLFFNGLYGDYLEVKVSVTIYGCICPVDLCSAEWERKPWWFNLSEYNSWTLRPQSVPFNSRPVNRTQDSWTQEPHWGFHCHLEEEDDRERYKAFLELGS